MAEKIIKLDNIEFAKMFLGAMDLNLGIFQEDFKIEIKHLDSSLKVSGEIDNFISFYNLVLELYAEGTNFTKKDLLYLSGILKDGSNESLLASIRSFYQKRPTILNTTNRHVIKPKSLNQLIFFDNLQRNMINFAVGPAGCGKTYLAVAYAVRCLKNNEVSKIIITRPVIEAGEHLGFLPGDLKEKVDPYLVPIYDCLYEFLGKENTERLIEKEAIEIAPLAYMRGRSLEKAIIILDEAQNATRNQMKMFLTRLGFDSKMIVCGDITQIDLNNRLDSGLVEAEIILKGIKGIGFSYFNGDDIMRNPLVSVILKRYEER